MSEFWKRKIRTFFHRLDARSEGNITKKDFELMAEKFCDAEKADAVRRAKMKGYFVDLWRKFKKSAGADDNKALTEDIMVESVRQQLNDKAFSHALDCVFRNLFIIIDTSGDGYLQIDEWRRLFDGWNFQDPKYTNLSFYAIDGDYDHKLSADEMMFALFDFLYSEDPCSPFIFFWGHLDP